MVLRVAPLLGVLVLVAVACGGRSYPTNRDDESYDLEAMSLAEEDLPDGFLARDFQSFDNDQWAAILDDVDPESKKSQLDAQGRVRNLISIFSWDNPAEHLGRPYQITSHSTLYGSADDASASLRQLCDLPLNEQNPTTNFNVPRIGNEAEGFTMIEQIPNFGQSVDTVVCFRTGRIVHAVVQSGLEGTSDVGLSVRLAERLLKRVNDAYDGKAPPPGETPSDIPPEDDETPAGGG
jgi:hypothetical protein